MLVSPNVPPECERVYYWVSAKGEAHECRFGFPCFLSCLRSVAPDDELLVQPEVCPAGETLVVETDVRDSNGDLLSRSAKSYGSGEATIVHRSRVPLDDLESGSYVLHLSARDPADGDATMRKIAFEISP